MCRKVKRFWFRLCVSDASVAALVSCHGLQICLLAVACLSSSRQRQRVCESGSAWDSPESRRSG